MVFVNGLPLVEFAAKSPLHSIQPPDETLTSPSDSLQPTRTQVDKLSVLFDGDGVTEQNKFEVSNLVFAGLRELHLPGYVLSRPSAYDSRGDGGFNRTLRLSRIHQKRYVADLSFSPMSKMAAFYRLETNPAHLSQADTEAIRELLSMLELGYGANLATVRVSRLDFAADYADLRLSQLALHRPKVQHFQSHISASHGIERVYHLDGQYLGSPQSDRQVRAYEFDGMTRIELIRRFNEGTGLQSAIDTAFFASLRVYPMSDLPELLPDFHPRYMAAVTSAIERFGLVGFLETLDLSQAELKSLQRKLAKTPQLWDSNAMIERATNQANAVASQLFDDAGAGHTLH